MANPKHAATLVGQRPFGSQWSEEYTPETEDDLAAIFAEAQEIPFEGMPADTAIPICRYFRLEAGEICGKERFLLTNDIAPDMEVVVRAGAHGLELALTNRDDDLDREVSKAWLIVGPAEDEEGNSLAETENPMMVWTAYPGSITARLPKDFFEKHSLVEGDTVPHEILSQYPNCAVKY